MAVQSVERSEASDKASLAWQATIIAKEDKHGWYSLPLRSLSFPVKELHAYSASIDVNQHQSASISACTLPSDEWTIRALLYLA